MINKNISLLVAFAATSFLVTSCMKEELSNNQSDAALNFRSAPASIDVTADWEEGATTMLNNTVHTAQNAKIVVWNNFSNGTSGRIGFQRWDQSGNASFGRTNGAGNNGTASHAFAFQPVNGSTKYWDAKVPFAFGNFGNREAIWTSAFEVVGVPQANMGLFVTDNGTGDENSTTGIIEVGDFRAIDGDLHESRPNKVIFRKWNGSSWVQIGRTNGSGDDGDLLALAVINARTDYTVSGGKVTAQTMEAIPVVKLQRSGNKKRLITDLPGGNIGSSMMLEY